MNLIAHVLFAMIILPLFMTKAFASDSFQAERRKIANETNLRMLALLREPVTVTALIEKLSTILKPGDDKFLLQMVSPSEDLLFKVERAADDSLILVTGQSRISFKIVDSSDDFQFRFTVNNRQLAADSQTPIEDLSAMIRNALPEQAKAALWPLLLPPAQAKGQKSTVAAGITATVATSEVSEECAYVSLGVDICKLGADAKWFPEEIWSLARKAKNYRPVSLPLSTINCDEKQPSILKTCLSDARLRTKGGEDNSVPSDLREYFKIYARHPGRDGDNPFFVK